MSTRVATGVTGVDLSSQNNGTRVCYQQFGEEVSFPRGELSFSDEAVRRQPRWFRFGDSCSIDVDEQIEIVNELLGNRVVSRARDDGTEASVSARRKKSVKAFYQKDEANCREYRLKDIPAIVRAFLDIWKNFSTKAKSDGTMLTQRDINPDDLAEAEDDFRMMLTCCNKIGRLNADLTLNLSTRPSRVSNVLTTSNTTASAAQRPDQPAEPNPFEPTPTKRPSRKRTLVTASDGGAGNFPAQLRLSELKCIQKNDKPICWKSARELASLELMINLVMEGDVVIDNIEAEMTSRKVKKPETIAIDELRLLSKTNLTNARSNVKSAREELLAVFEDHMTPQADCLLHEWLDDCKRYAAGNHVQDDITELDPNGRQVQRLKVDKAWGLRHIMFSFNIPLHQIAPLWAVFYSLIMGRAIQDRFLVVSTAIWNNVMRLGIIDKMLTTSKFTSAIQELSKFGFRRAFYSSQDDSKDAQGQNRHVNLVSHFDTPDTGDWRTATTVNPSSRLVTAAVNNVKSSNAKKNAKDIIDLMGLKAAVYYGGGCNDNAGDAQKEIRDTFHYIMKEAEESDDPSIRELVYVNGVKRRPLSFGDPFHWQNLAVMYASKGFAGDTENAEHQQIHHRQAMMSMHSLHSDDPSYSQAVMDRVMAGEPRSIRLRTWRERQQRWLVNQRFAKAILNMLLYIKHPCGSIFVVLWALYFANKNRSSWKARVGKELATWFSMPEIVLGLHFETEIGEYFEATTAWQNRPGPIHTSNGYRMMEVHDLYLDFELPWWNNAIENPRSSLPKTMAYLDKHFEGDDHARRLEQIMAGLKCGRDELIKMTKG